jgi:hypothetical protein
MYGTLKAGDGFQKNPFLFFLIATITIDMVIANLVVYSLGGNVSQASGQLLQKWMR